MSAVARRGDAFGASAQRYDDARPSYPSALVVELMRTGPREVLDVGCGTGKLGVLLAARGARVLGVEIDDRMAAVARRHGLSVEIAAFETWADAGRRFGLLVSGQAWHWLDPPMAARRAHELLAPDGRIGLCWNYGAPPPDLRPQLDAVYDRYGRGLGEARAVDAEERVASYRHELSASGLFDAIEVLRFGWQQRLSSEQYVQMLSTYSDHAALSEQDRTALLDAIRDALDRAGGGMAIDYTTHAFSARPVPGD